MLEKTGERTCSVCHFSRRPCIYKVRQYSEEWGFNNRPAALLLSVKRTAQACASTLLPLFFPSLLLPSTWFSSFVSVCHSHFLYLPAACLSVVLSFVLHLISPNPSSIKEKEGHEYHTQTLSHTLHSSITATRFFPSQLPPFFLCRKQ